VHIRKITKRPGARRDRMFWFFIVTPCKSIEA
jgi:hypothetical protein